MVITMAANISVSPEPAAVTSSPAVSPESSLLAQLAEFSCGIRYADVPAAVKHQAQLNILDTIACIASGARLEDSRRLLRAELARGGPEEASVLGHHGRLPIEAATRVNAYMG